ncbi:SpoIIE family protein phosphatase [Conexibacter stalactiti]|uniref:SpoIIE family protein phosphatase n=1 Tax=Conexibacter stalactiti TaxID=1940611 RepID=A0ABU4HSY1_9ACTN|nr:SpoIIE family protein phosphatase [Conexibacter stalactiti]MDW5596432.1 SpoIIE family protein phosphatase [Conexibacter stalactiti]MEC5037074.1 SpoIIE family protein phosphatase [Conexibacter stalactiti]
MYDEAPCGFLSTLPDGSIVKVNRTLAEWTGYTREELLQRRFVDLLTAGGRIYHETHYAPLLSMQGAVREIAVELRRADGTRLPVLVNSVLKRDAEERPLLIYTTVFDATERRRYERELLRARDVERRGREEEAEVAHVLQSSMLASQPLTDERVRVGTAYQPAIESLEVGGDWHDAFAIDADRVGVVVGDVVGRGIGAATVMGQLRSATRALALAGLDGPAAVVTALDRFAADLPQALMATLVYAEIEPASGAVRLLSAGHPPPLLLAPDRDPVVIGSGRWLPLGVAHAGERPVEARLTLAPGAQLLLYSDGLVERRGESFDRGVARLADALSRMRGHDPQALVDMLMELFGSPASARDDVCLLSVERAAQPSPGGVT